MIRSLTIAVSVLLIGTTPVLAQSHPGSHTPPHPPRPHGPGHMRPSGADHAAMHALLGGNWTGTMRGPWGDSASAGISVAFDSTRGPTLSVRADQPFRFGVANDLAIEAGGVSWTQDVSGRACRATAVVHAAAPAAATLDGRMTCADGDLTFTLRKTAG